MRSFLLNLGQCKSPLDPWWWIGNERGFRVHASLTGMLLYLFLGHHWTFAGLTMRTVNPIGIHLHLWICCCLEVKPTIIKAVSWNCWWNKSPRIFHGLFQKAIYLIFNGRWDPRGFLLVSFTVFRGEILEDSWELGGAELKTNKYDLFLLVICLTDSPIYPLYIPISKAIYRSYNLIYNWYAYGPTLLDSFLLVVSNGFYHGKSAWETTIWENNSWNFFQSIWMKQIQGPSSNKTRQQQHRLLTLPNGTWHGCFWLRER